MKRSEFRFFDRLRVRWAEVDMQKIVFNGHYLMYFDTAVASYWRALALPYAATMEHFEGDLYVRKATVEYEGSAHYDDLCDVGLRCARIGNSSMSFVAALFRGERLLVHGELVYVFADPTTQTSKPVPPGLRELLLGFEAGEAMYEVRSERWQSMAADVQALRRAVFVDEQGVGEAIVADEADLQAVHVVARNRLGVALATGRLLLKTAAGLRTTPSGQSGHSGQIGRMAVMQPLRGSGIGSACLRALLQAARERRLNEVMLQAEANAVPFYAAHGFIARGQAFEAEGIVHQEMWRAP